MRELLVTLMVSKNPLTSFFPQVPVLSHAVGPDDEQKFFYGFIDISFTYRIASHRLNTERKIPRR
jgi:hypothetical protein